MTKILEARSVVKEFGGIRAADNISFHVEEGEIYSIIGPNGAGKTTLFNLISGFLPVTSGEILYKGKSITGRKPHQLSRMGICRTFQLTTVYPMQSVIENLIIGQSAGKHFDMFSAIFRTRRKRRAEREAIERAHDLAEYVGVSNYKNLPASALPQVAQKQLTIGLALATRPELLLLDELVGGVNMEETETIIDIIRKIRDSGKTICLIEHKMSIVMNISDRILALNYGEKACEGASEEVCANDVVIKSYLGDKYAAVRESDL
ncbi:MAG: ABC transporter ATP-binding protein [Desulfobacterales bacterium]|nr:ABC transporter ATP-binding protein [Desulfobacterales bacterium]